MKKIIVLLLALGVVFVQGQALRSQTTKQVEFNTISRRELELLFLDTAKKNPMAAIRLAANPEMKKKQLRGLRDLLAFASQAEKEGIADEPSNKQELLDQRIEVTAANFDDEINKSKIPGERFRSITPAQIQRYWGDASRKAALEAEFSTFLKNKLLLLSRENPGMGYPDAATPEETEDARNYFAKTRIYWDAYEAKVKARTLAPEFIERTNLMVKLQHAQFLAKLYSKTLTEKTEATDDEIAQYISKHAELSTVAKRARALDILKRAKAGEDFAALANEFSEDPGNKSSDGKLNGGLYADVKKGTMVKPFEDAALALDPGQVSPDLVESEFGFHIIKLEKRSGAKDENGNPEQSYSVRHILIQTMYTNPTDPTAGPRPVREYVKETIEGEKQRKLIEDLVAANNISVPDDFTIPSIAESKTKVLTKKPTTTLRKVVHKRVLTRKRAHN